METPHALPVISLYWTGLKHRYPTARWPTGLRRPARNQRVAGSISGGDIYFNLELFSCFPSLQVGEALTNEIKHDHSPVVIVVLDPIHDLS